MLFHNLTQRLIQKGTRASYRYDRGRIKKCDFTIISNDCWGGQIYKNLGLKYLTPFVGLMVMAPCYIELLTDAPTYLKSSIRFKSESKYEYINTLRKEIDNFFPIGVLRNSVEIHFMHYSSVQEAEQKWNRRINRINWDRIFVKFDSSKDLCTDELLQAFDKLAYKKICFSAQKNDNIKSLIHIPDWVIDGNAMSRISIKHFDAIDWINGGDGRVTLLNRILQKVQRLGNET